MISLVLQFSFYILRKKYFTWWDLDVMFKYFSISLRVMAVSNRPSTICVSKVKEYWPRPMWVSQSCATKWWSISPIFGYFLKQVLFVVLMVQWLVHFTSGLLIRVPFQQCVDTIIGRPTFNFHYNASSHRLGMHLIGQSGRLNASDWLMVAVVEVKSEPLDYARNYGGDRCCNFV